MDINNLTQLEKFSQSMDAKEICILVVNDDYVCFNIIASMLKNCTYEDFNFERPSDAIKVIWEKKDKIKVVVTNVHRADINSFGMIQHIIENDFKLPTFLLSPDENTKIVSSGLPSGVTLCFAKDLSVDDIKKLYKDTLVGERGGVEAMESSRISDKNVGETSNKATNTSYGGETNQKTHKRKRKERSGSSSEQNDEQNDDSEDESHVQKRKRIVWTNEMHHKFLDAMAQIGYDRAFPKKIVEVMNVSGLTRENVASHLQKYRMCLKKSQEGTDKNFNSLGTCQHYWSSSQLASRNILSSSGYSSVFGSLTSRVRLAPPSYKPFDPKSSRVNLGNVQQQPNQTVNVNEKLQVYSDPRRDILMRILNKKPTNNIADDQGTSSSTTKSAFMGLRLASDGKTLRFGDSDISEIRTDLDFSTRGGNDFQFQQSGLAPKPNVNTDNYPQDYSLPPLPESYVENSAPILEIDENMVLNSYTMGQLDTFLDQQSSMPWETLGTVNPDLTATNLSDNLADLQINLPPLPSEIPWYPNSDSNILLNQSHSLPQSQTHWDPNPEMPSTSFTDILINQPYSLIPSQSDIPWSFDQNFSSVPPTFNSNFLDQQNVVPPLVSQTHEVAPQHLHPLPTGTTNEAFAQPSMTLPPESDGLWFDGGTENLQEGTGNTSPDMYSLGALAAELMKDL